MSHDPKTRKCKGCGRAIGYGAYCGSCRKARRQSGMWRKRSGARRSSKPSLYVALGATSPAGATGQIVAHPINPNPQPEVQS